MAGTKQEQDTRPHVLILGAGFGGLYAARALGKLPVRVTLVDRKNHHTFQPLLYQVATAGLSPGDIASPVRRILRKYKNIRVFMAEAAGFDLANKTVKLENVSVPYDYLIVATGATHSYFGHPEWEHFAPGLKTVEDALEIRHRILLVFENAERQQAVFGRHDPLNFIVVGAGPTGVELAGAIAEIARRVMVHDFHFIDPGKARVLLLEYAPRVLPSYPEDLSHSAEKQLQKLGVEVRTGAMVTDITPRSVKVGNEEIPAAVTLWAAGVKASPLGAMLGEKTDKAGRVLVNQYLNLASHPEVFVIGDLAWFIDSEGKTLPGVSPVAIQMGNNVAANIGRDLRHESRKPFVYFDKGSMATIGRAAAVAMVGKLHLSGFIAWMAWLFIHILYLIGFRNRAVVMLEWLWAYLRYEKAARLITTEECEDKPA
jgi:NADH:ubiquinone reductase (H+-translocating)